MSRLILCCLPLLAQTVLGFVAMLPIRAYAEGLIKGVVLNNATEEPLAYANVRVLAQPMGTMTNIDGRFEFRIASPGRYDLVASMIGYRAHRLDRVRVDSGSVTDVVFRLEQTALLLKAITVTPGRFSIMQKDPVVTQTLTREDIATIPQFGEDIYRAVTRLPGISSNDFSAKFTVRGGEHEEVLATLDGMELYDPFHLKDINGGALSIVDVMAIGGIDLMTGAFPAQHGGHLSGVFDISSRSPKPERQSSLGISLMNVRFMSEGQFNKGNGGWLVSARRGYLDIVLEMMNEEELKPKYYDVFGKVEYDLNDRHTLSVHALRAGDEMVVQENEDRAESNYGNSYFWLKVNSAFARDLAAQTVLSFSRVEGSRDGLDLESRSLPSHPSPIDEVQFHVIDNRNFNVLGLKQDWNWEATSRHLLSWGFDLKRLAADYGYFNRNRFFGPAASGAVGSFYDTTRVTIEPLGHEVGFYAGDRFHLARRVTAEVGLRYDRASHTGDRDLSPRGSLVFNPTQRTAIRAGWGLYHQSHDIHELDVEYGDQDFYRSQRSEHRVIGFEHVFTGGTQLRLEAYQKRLSHIRPRYENLSKDVLFFPEVEEEHLFLRPGHGEARGIELYLKRDVGGKLSFWSSYALGWADERIDGVDVAKNADQRHTFYIDANYRPNRNWRFNMAWQYRSGWPFSDQFYVRRDVPLGVYPYKREYGDINAARFPSFHRLDLRVNRAFDLERGEVSLFLEVINLYNRDNIRLIEAGSLDVTNDGDLVVTSKHTEKWFPLLPSIGASWAF